MTDQPRPDDPIELLREQIRVATDAAERLVREAGLPPEPPGSARSQGAEQGPRGQQPTGGPPSDRDPTPPGPPQRRPPPPGPPPSGPPPPRPGSIPERGWDAPDSHRDAASELQALGKLFATVRELLPEDLQEQVTELIRQLLLVLRALIDWAVARIERGPRGSEVRVEDIPIA
jgi:hypothetical protein